jgi:hypothetical protein
LHRRSRRSVVRGGGAYLARAREGWIGLNAAAEKVLRSLVVLAGEYQDGYVPRERLLEETGLDHDAEGYAEAARMLAQRDLADGAGTTTSGRYALLKATERGRRILPYLF